MIKFRASSVGNLCVGGNAITDKQREDLQKLLDRQNDKDGKPLTKSMETKRDELIAKRDADFEFGATALSYIRECWLRNEYGFDEPVLSNEMLKGLLQESTAIGVVGRQLGGPFRVKNEQEYENAYFTGTPDIILDDAIIEDVKCSWSLKTFMDPPYNPLYYCQGQVYLDLTGRDTFRLCYVLVNTPPEIILEEQKRFYFRFNCDEESPVYKECIAKVESMHDISRIPEEDRIKVFTYERNDLFIMKLRKRVEQAREVYETLTLKGES